MIHDLHNLALRLAPELAAHPLYVLPQPTTLPKPVNAIAYVVRGPCAPLQQHLEAAGLWHGVGPAIVLTSELKGDEAVVTLLHETAHLLPARKIEPVEVTADEILADIAAMSQWASNPNPRTNEPRWVVGDHGRDFTRVALHLWWRAALLGIVTDFAHLCAGLQYDLSPAFLYWRALGNEAVRMKDESFDEILSTEPPTDFQDLWRADLARWMQLHHEVKQ